MPNNAASQAAAAAPDPKPVRPVNPDRVGEELADDARIWPIYNRIAREDDERLTKAWDNGLNNLALFAGLFSAVTTAFIIEAQEDMKPDYAQLTFLVLNATNSGVEFIQQPFIVPSSARTVHCLWLASLVLSLSAALIAIMGKDWIGMYTARPVCNLRQWAEMRSYRLRCIERWHMSGVIAAAPVLLHVSLLLFGAGLVLFISSDPFTHRLTLGLSLAAGVLYLVTTFSAVIFSTSPFKSPATQMIRAALSAIFSYLQSIIYRPKRNLIHALLCDINAMAVGRADVTALLSGHTPDNGQLRFRQRTSAVLSAAGGAAIAHVRKIPALLQVARDHLQWSCVRWRVVSVASVVCRIPISDWFLASTWTDLSVDRRHHLVADALSWLSGASQAPDVFRAVVFALGDLEIGRQVGSHTAPALHTRLRAEIRRTWEQVDFLTLSRLVLADRNTAGRPVLDYCQFHHRFDLSKDSALRCEDGLAAVIVVSPDDISPLDIEPYTPNEVAQPRMLEFLLPYIQKTGFHQTDVLILLSNRYREHLSTTRSFNIEKLQAHLYQSLSAGTRKAYAREVTVRRSGDDECNTDLSQIKYGGRGGAIELLTFLCDDYSIRRYTKPAAVELIMGLRKHRLIREHRCLAYLFGSSELRRFAWPEKPWSLNDLWYLSDCLGDSLCHPFQPSSVRTPSHDREFDLALARTSVMLLSSEHHTFILRREHIEFLSGHLSLSSSIPDNDDKLDVIRLILERAALLNILDVSVPSRHGDDDEIASFGTVLLAAIISYLVRRLRDPATIGAGEKLFSALVLTQVTGPDGDTRTWDLGDWLRVQAPKNLSQRPSTTAPMQDVHEALAALYPLCQVNPELRAHWDRIGYPGRPGDIFSDPFLDVGAFFARAERPPAPPETPDSSGFSDLH